MKLTFLGAAHEVTGSRFLLEACGKNILVDYGMEQGLDLYENTPLPLPAASVDCVFLTHAHIDHSGWLPLLYKKGFRGRIFTTEATESLCAIMLMDSAHIQEMEAEWATRKATRKGEPPVEPAYTTQDATETIKLFAPIKYMTQTDVYPGIAIRMIDVGHMLGSASIEVSVTEDGTTETIVFSGDIGNKNQPLLRDPHYFTEADFVVMESTYGDRSHGPVPDFIGTLVDVLNTTFKRGGNVVIPSFAVGRTQELLYFLRQIKQDGLIKEHPNFPVYIDSPLAIEATQVFKEHMYGYMDQETVALLKQGINPISFDGLKVAQTADESKLINEDQTPKVIISASGMCDAGRIRHHLKHNLWRPECTVLFVGYQAVGTLGRILQDGADEVKLFGETIRVKAEIRKLDGISGHADNRGLMEWIGAFGKTPRHVFVLHGDDDITELFAARVHDELGLQATAPYNGESWDLTQDIMLKVGNREKIKRAHETPGLKPKPQPRQETEEPEPRRESAAYERLQDAGSRIQALVAKMERSSKKNQNKLASALFTLVKRYQKR
ncbi:MAG TPA: MBL fold metallo-hydrolase [Candidatus Limiplasma sp.]|nr:MBL fold metallo-hydrolase [Candidatus Limiplasma sp.]HRX09758.1 MBL fold metallo-hydrolase [Candidatus Limiplasma sp.]